MALTPLKLHFIGSFQNEMAHYFSEDPLAEVWDHVSRLGTSSFQQRHFIPDKKDIPWDKYLKYTQIRIRQSIEFREASSSASIITSPLSLYYSFLSLTRAFLALGPEIMPKEAHGLKFIKSNDLLTSRAVLTKGTFTDYLDSLDIPWQKDDEITLSEALGFIIELANDYQIFDQNSSRVQTISVKAIMQGPARLVFHNPSKDFEGNWAKKFPQLADTCSFETPGCLLINDQEIGKDYQHVAQYLSTHLLPSLTLLNNAVWYAFIHNDKAIQLSRVGYYYVAMFILGSAVRYEPELILPVSAPDSEVGWLLRRFLNQAERYFPQLKLAEFYNSEIYF